jgi:hypothetical protein
MFRFPICDWNAALCVRSRAAVKVNPTRSGSLPNTARSSSPQVKHHGVHSGAVQGWEGPLPGRCHGQYC